MSGAHTVLVTISFSATTADDNRGCGVSFSGNNGSTINGTTIATQSDARAAGAGESNGAAGRDNAGSRTEMVVTAAGTTTFQMAYRRSGGGTCTFTNMSIITQVY